VVTLVIYLVICAEPFFRRSEEPVLREVEGTSHDSLLGEIPHPAAENAGPRNDASAKAADFQSVALAEIFSRFFPQAFLP